MICVKRRINFHYTPFIYKSRETTKISAAFDADYSIAFQKNVHAFGPNSVSKKKTLKIQTQ
ncbi:hypothetical protein BJV82DRAFT_619307 [Fennellomyces sp. T-0311]|nr:hypothetical protein BJV82DRAFT_619307 [Fennellomyces sp. T-0311]